MTPLHGFDISAYQPAAWTRDCSFLFVKATEGNFYVSSRFTTQWAGAKTHAGVRGAYHFARPEQSSYKDQLNRLLDKAQPVAGEMVMLDLEASKLSQAATNAWARGWGDLLREQVKGVTSVLYMGSAYASNGTGKDLNRHFDFWMYPQYPGAYQVRAGMDVEELRAANRSEAEPGRRLIAASTTKWPPAVSPWLPSGLTCGWSKPHIWQFTDNWSGLDASVTALTVADLSGGTAPKPPAPQPKPWPGRYLKVASPMMHGSDVKYVQERLNNHGAKVVVDGEYGPKTAAAVKAFQKASKLTADGIVGPKTWAALAK